MYVPTSEFRESTICIMVLVLAITHLLVLVEILLLFHWGVKSSNNAASTTLLYTSPGVLFFCVVYFDLGFAFICKPEDQDK